MCFYYRRNVKNWQITNMITVLNVTIFHEMLEKLDITYVEKYGMSLVENLKDIHRKGIDEYLKCEQD